MTPEDFKLRVQAMEADAREVLEHTKKLVANAVLLYNELETKPFSDRRQAVLDLINEYVDVPVIPEWMEEKAIGYLVDEALRIVDLNPSISVEVITENLDD